MFMFVKVVGVDNHRTIHPFPKCLHIVGVTKILPKHERPLTGSTIMLFLICNLNHRKRRIVLKERF